ncbi:hypothetical protein [Streptomyces sp. NPDC058664]|uniref:deazapurine DNA modification protein DpdA family protein n=1 Tax=unclassified Streptomyces TaxID=2593676 RepID=UPI003651EA57
MNGATFYLGAKPHLLQHTDKPLFVSDSTLREQKKLKPAKGRYSVDSGGFSELQENGHWTRSPRQYADDLVRYAESIGPYDWAAQQDWMCEEAIIHGGIFNRQRFVGTGLSVVEHQRRTVGNFLDLMSINDKLKIIPVVQGDRPAAYEQCINLYDQAGIRLTDYPVVGIGSVCRIQATRKAVDIVQHVSSILGTNRLHGFGFKTEGLRLVGHLLGSADSHAWSLNGRHKPGCDFRLSRDKPHKNEANCLRYALAWRDRVLDALADSRPAPFVPEQLAFDYFAPAA